MRKLFKWLALTVFFIFNFFSCLESTRNPFGNVEYEVEKDSATVNEMIYSLTKERYDKLLNEGETFAWEPDETKNSFSIPINGKDFACACVVEKSLSCENNSLVTLCSFRYLDQQRSWLCEKLSDGHLEHDYVAWQAFEWQVLGTLGLKYKKNWNDLIRFWCANWFFDNQLYFIAFAMLLYYIPNICNLLKKLYKNVFAK